MTTRRPDNAFSTDMRFMSIGSQAGIFDTKLVSGFLMDIFEKLHEVHQTYKVCSEELERGRASIDSAEATMTTMQTTLGTFSNTVDSLSVHLLQEGASLSHKQLTVEKIRKDVALKRLHVEELAKSLTCPRDVRWREQCMSDIKQERAKLELQLANVNGVIDTTYEETFSVQERIDGIKELRENRRADHVTLMESLTEKCNKGPTLKSQLLSLTGTDCNLDMRDVYVSPTELTQLRADIELIKHKQLQCDRHIQMQTEEKEFLVETTQEISRKVYDLERKVRQEKGDHGFESGRTKEPEWYQDLGKPTLWFTSPTLTQDQLKMVIDRQSMVHRYTRTRTDRPGTSTIVQEEEKVVTTDLLMDDVLRFSNA